MIRIIRTNPGNSDFQCLVSLLDAELKVSDGKEHSFFAQFNKIDSINYAVVAYSDNFPAGCGAFKKYSDDIAEIKRMFVREEFRGNGIAKLILNELESWANELNFT